MSLPVLYDGLAGARASGRSLKPADRQESELLDVTWREVPTTDIVISPSTAWRWLAGLAVVAFALAGVIAVWAVVTVP